MRTTDFQKVGNFYSNGKKITFVSLAEEVLLRKDFDFIKVNGFEKLDKEILAVEIEKDASLLELVNVARGLKFCKVPVYTKGFKFPSLLKIHFNDGYFQSRIFPEKFPASQVCKALVLLNEDESQWDTEQRLVFVDYATKMPQSTDEVVIFPKVIKGFKTIYPTDFDTWVKVLLKAREFKTTNKEYLLLKSLFKIK